MSDQRFQSQPPQHTDVPRPRRAEGQWAFGYREPLNKNESCCTMPMAARRARSL